MIILVHNNEELVHVRRHKGDFLDYSVKNIISAIVQFSKDYPDEIICWYKLDLEGSVQLDSIESLLKNKRTFLSYSALNSLFVDDKIGYVEDTPSSMVNLQVRYPTWRMSADVGAIYGSCVVKFNIIPHNISFDYWLNSLAKVGKTNGLFCYSEPFLVDNSKIQIRRPNKCSSDFTLFKFVYQHYKTRWIFVLFVSYLIFEKKIVILPFLTSLGYKKLNKVSPVAFESNYEEVALSPTETIDVVIPTMGRKDFLLDTLKDLSKQSFLPRKVVIVEQNPELNSDSELDYLNLKSWPFQIKHLFLRRTGACNARNVALAHVNSDWIFFADDDIRVPSHFLELALKSLLGIDGKVMTFSCLRPEEQERLEQVVQWDSFGSGCSIVHHKIASSTRFDLSYEHGFGEDKDYGMQIRHKGYDVLYNPLIQLKHLKATVGGFRNKYIRPWEKSQIFLKPSPTVMHFKLKYASREQLKGYKLRLFIKFYLKQRIINPISYSRNFTRGWKNSLIWAKKIRQEK